MQRHRNKYTTMRIKNNRLETLRLIISSREMCNQEQLLEALRAEGYSLTQATLSRDLKQLNVAKAATINGNYVYVLPNVSMYKRLSTPNKIKEMMTIPGFRNITFSGNMGVIRTLPGYASSIAYNIDNSNIRDVLGTIAGDDTIFIVLREDADKDAVLFELSKVVPNMN